MKAIFIYLIIFIYFSSTKLYSQQSIIADPNLTSILVEYSGTPTVKIGESLNIGVFNVGGFLESRNEKRFHQCVLPNHNWRGYLFLNYSYHLQSIGLCIPKITFGFDHESAHPTGGFYERNDEAYEMIYDGLYRNINLNAFKFSPILHFNRGFDFVLQVDYLFYIFSKNTPELHNTDLTNGHGVSGGLDIIVSLSPAYSFFISIFGRYTFQSSEKRTDWIYRNYNGTVIQSLEEYPIFNSTKTIVIKTGILFTSLLPSRKFGIYTRLLYGNPYGFVDSRENRLIISAGIEILKI